MVQKHILPLSPGPVAEKSCTIHTDKLFDSKNKVFLKDISVQVSQVSGLITKVYNRQHALPTRLSPQDIDLRGKTVLAGFVDVHTHVFLHASAETSPLNQERDESFVERILRATNHCRAALLAGYTTYRDLGTEGLSDADIGLRDGINRGLIPGPRLFVATEPLASSGGYEIRQENRLGGTTVPRLSDPCDGVDGVRAGVRRRIGAGADLVKFYADYRKRALRFPAQTWKGALPILHPPGNGLLGSGQERSPSLLLFGQDEMDAIVREAKIARCPVAAHAVSGEAAVMAAKAGVTTLEHNWYPGDEPLHAMKEHGTIFVPTLAVVEAEKSEVAEGMFEMILERAKKAWEMGVQMACGGDTGAFAHGENAREMELMVMAGIPINEVLSNATIMGWKACGGDWCGRRFGCIEEGWAADLVALDGDVEVDFGVVRKVNFVMKDAVCYVQNGRLLM